MVSSGLPGEYPDTPVKALEAFQIGGAGIGQHGKATALFDMHVNPDMNVLVGCGLGGTSLINANVSLKADRRVFDDPRWPAGIVDADLEGRLHARLGDALAGAVSPSDGRS